MVQLNSHENGRYAAILTFQKIISFALALAFTTTFHDNI